MKRSALAVVLVFSVHHLASAQHQGTSSSSSSSSGSSGSYNGGSAGYSGGGGGSYHSSGSSGGSSGYGGSSGTYSGGSHSSASSGSISGGYSGGSRSPASVTSPSNPGSHSGGSSQGSHSNTHAVFSGSSGNIPGGSRDTSSHSNIRVSDGVDGNAAKIGSGENSRPGFTPGMIFQSSPSKTMSDPRRPNSIQDEAWMHQPFQIEVPSETPDKKTLAHILAERGREVGLEPTKSAYKQTMTPLSGPEPHHVSWVGKLFGAKPTLTKTTPGSQLRPCRGEDCGKNPRPKPCLGANCPKPGPPPKPLPLRWGRSAGPDIEAPTELAGPGVISETAPTTSPTRARAIVESIGRQWTPATACRFSRKYDINKCCCNKPDSHREWLAQPRRRAKGARS